MSLNGSSLGGGHAIDFIKYQPENDSNRVRVDEEKKAMAEKHRFKKNREFKKRLDATEENEEGDIRTFKFHKISFGDRDDNGRGDRRRMRERKSYGDNDRDGRRGGKSFKGDKGGRKGGKDFGKKFNNKRFDDEI